MEPIKGTTMLSFQRCIVIPTSVFVSGNTADNCSWTRPFALHSAHFTVSNSGYTITEDLCDNNEWVRLENETRVQLPAEMSGRTKVLGLGVSAIIAGASAIALTIADKAQNKSALVGIGISASLLPPAVNCGMLFVFHGLGKDPKRSESLSFDVFPVFALPTMTIL